MVEVTIGGWSYDLDGAPARPTRRCLIVHPAHAARW
jgi:hypothetical protein